MLIENKRLDEPITPHLSCWPQEFREDLLNCLYDKSMGGNDPHGVATLEFKGVVSRVYVGENRTLSIAAC